MLNPMNHTRRNYSIISREKPFQARERGRSKIREKSDGQIIDWRDLGTEARKFRKRREIPWQRKGENWTSEGRKCGIRREVM
jgi:hypothetical protein